MQVTPVAARPAAPAPPPRRVDPLARDIVVAMLVKLVALVLLWLAFFRPAEAPQPLDPPAVARHLAAPAPAAEAPVAVH